MADKILLNDAEFNFRESDLPTLIHYEDHMGGSNFSIAMVADLFYQGSKILFLCAYHMAEENFMEQIDNNYGSVAFVNQTKDWKGAEDSQVVILDCGDEGRFFDALHYLKDIHERIIFVKNIEKFSPALFESAMEFEKVILSGNLDKCEAKDLITSGVFQTIIAFSRPHVSLPVTIPRELPRWSAYLTNGPIYGIIRVVKD